MAMVLDLSIFVAGWVLAQILFKGYEAHVPLAKRAAKLAVLTLVFSPIHYFFGRGFFYGLLALMSVGIGILHGYWFHYRNGIHWRTAEPRDKYLQLIGEEGTE